MSSQEVFQKALSEINGGLSSVEIQAYLGLVENTREKINLLHVLGNPINEKWEKQATQLVDACKVRLLELESLSP